MTGAKRPLPKGWLELPIAEVADVALGKTPKKSHYTNEGKIRLIKFRDVIEDKLDLSETKDAFVRDEPAAIKDLRPVQKGDVLLTASAHSPEYIGRKIAIIDELPEGFDYFYVGELLNIRPHDGVDPRWIAAYLRSEQGYKNIQAHVHGMHLTNGRAQNVPIRIASLKYMQTAVQAIEVLQARSRRAREALAEVGPLLEQFRQSVLAAAFRGDLTADWRAAHPNVEPASKLLHRIRAERRRCWEQAELAKYEARGQKPPKDWQDKYKEPEPVDDSDLPELPEGWCWARWNEVGFCQNGRAFPSENYAPTGVKLLRPGNLHVSGAIVWTPDNTRYMPIEWEDEYPTYVVRADELIMNLTAQSLKDEFLGRVCLTGNDEHCLLNQRLARITPVLLSSDFCLILFKSPVFRRYVDTLNTGSLIQHMFTSQVDEFVLPLPPHDEQLALIATVTRSLQVKDSVEALITNSCKELDILEQSILAKAFCGDLVPQDPSDEPASVLLERIRAQRAQQAKATKQPSKTQWRNKVRKNSSRLTLQYRPLVEVLTTKGQPMPPQQLLTEAGYDDDSIEDFYSALREEIAQGRIRENRLTESDVLLEAV